MIDITLLGTSALVPLPERALTAALLTCAGRSILFDCGEGTQTAARTAGVSLMKTDLIALTHFHGDHIFGLPGLLQTMNSMGREAPLYITGPDGLKESMAPLMQLVGWTGYEIRFLAWPQSPYPLCDVIPGWPGEAALCAFPTEHRTPSQGYAFTLSRPGKFMPEKAKALGVPVTLWGMLQKGNEVSFDGVSVSPHQVVGPPRRGLKFVFTGDTMACPSVTEGAKGADLLICEATYGENEQAQLAIDHGHMNFAQAAQTAADAGARLLWLSHYSQMIQDPETYLPLAQSIFPFAQCGRDGMQITLEFDKDS